MHKTNRAKLFVTFALGVACARLLAAPSTEKIPVGGKGFVAVVPACSVPHAVMTNVVDNFYKIMMIRAEVVPGKWSLATASKDLKATKANAAVFIVDDPALPMSLVALESKWAVMNARGLSDLAFSKELQRMLCVVLGAPYSKFETSTLRPAYSPRDLETMKGDGITFDTLISICENIKPLGIKQYRFLDREDAIEEGYIKP